MGFVISDLGKRWQRGRIPFEINTTAFPVGSANFQAVVAAINYWNNNSGEYGLLYNTAGCPVQCAPYSFGSQGFNVISMTSPPHFMQGAGGSYPNVLPRIDVGQLFAFMKSLDGKPNPQFCNDPNDPASCTPFSFAGVLPSRNPFNSYDVIEKTLTTGPISAVDSIPFSMRSSSVRLFRIGMIRSATSPTSRATEIAIQRSPADPNAAPSRACVTCSRSASGMTTMWFLAPPRACTRLPEAVPSR